MSRYRSLAAPAVALVAVWILFSGIPAFGQGIISTVAGKGAAGFSGDGGKATSAELWNPQGVAVDSVGNIYISDGVNDVIRKVNAGTGAITTIAGTPQVPGYSGDGGLAVDAHLNSPEDVAIDSAGNIYFADMVNEIIRKITAKAGIISTIAGTPGASGYGGDDGPATAAHLYHPKGVAVDSSGNVYIADTQNNVVREINAKTGVIKTVAGTPQRGGLDGSGGPATSANLSPWGIALDHSDNLFIADYSGNVIWEVIAKTGIINIVAGDGNLGYRGDGGKATSAVLWQPRAVTVDPAGNFYIADLANHVVREVDASTGIISTIAGNGTSGYSGDGKESTLAELGTPFGLALDVPGNLYIDDYGDNVVRKVAMETVSAPTFVPPAGTYASGEKVSIEDSTPGATIYYTANGTTPTTASTKYVGPITVTTAETFKAMAVAPAAKNSAVVSATYVIDTGTEVPVIQWQSPAPITYGAGLTSSQLDAKATYDGVTVSGTFSYTPPLGTVLTAGVHALSVTFVPAKPSIYTIVKGTATLTVDKAIPTLSFSVPLSATATFAGKALPGKVSYSPGTGTSIPANKTTKVTVTFTPSDTIDFDPATAVIEISPN